jgi:sugar O-acyltransferase (sialic acid O-acetyltransferase NeuD family)
VLFGLNDFAELAHYYLTNDSPHEVVAFTVNAQYIGDTKTFKGLPVVPFEEVDKLYPPQDYAMFAPMAPNKMNRVRQSVYEQIKAKGYELISYISTKATVLTTHIGDNCFILEDNTIQPFVHIGNNVVMWSGNHIGHHSVIADHVMFTSHVVLSGHCVVESYTVFGVNSTIRDGITIAEGTFVAMGASIIKPTESWGIYMGNPAKKSEKSSKEV